MPSYFCRSSNEDLDILSWSVIYQERAHHSTYAQLALHHCYFAVRHANCNSCQFLWRSSKPAATGYDPRHVPERSPRGWRDKLWRNSKPSHSAAGHPVATQRTSYLSHFQVLLCSHSQACVRKSSSETHHQIYKNISVSRDSIFAVQLWKLMAEAPLKFQRGPWWCKVLWLWPWLFPKSTAAAGTAPSHSRVYKYDFQLLP